MEKKLENIIYDGAVDFVAHSMLNCFDYKAIEVKEKENNFFEVFIPIDFEKIYVTEEKFFSYLESDLHYLPIIFGIEIIDNGIVNKNGLYYGIGGKIVGYLGGISFNKDEKMIFSLLEETDENETLEYKTICTIQIIFQSNEI